MKFKLINELNESKLIRQFSYLGKYTYRDILDFTFLNILAFQILRHEPEYKSLIQNYLTDTLRFTNVDYFKQHENDLYNFLHVMFGRHNEKAIEAIKDTGDKARLISNNSADWTEFKYYLSVLRFDRPRNIAAENRFLLKLESDLMITESNYRSMRRIIRNWKDANYEERSVVMTRLLMAFRSRMYYSELREPLENLARKFKYEIHNVDNPEELNESKVFYHQSNSNKNIPIFENPSKEQVKNLLKKSKEQELRAIVTRNRIIVVDSYLLTHAALGKYIDKQTEQYFDIVINKNGYFITGYEDDADWVPWIDRFKKATLGINYDWHQYISDAIIEFKPIKYLFDGKPPIKTFSIENILSLQPILNEDEDLTDSEDFYIPRSFWFNTKTKELFRAEDEHIDYIYDNPERFGLDDETIEQSRAAYKGFAMETWSSVIRLAADNHWVRGGTEYSRDTGLYLQGNSEDILAAARYFNKHKPLGVLYMDSFIDSFNPRDAIKIEGKELAHWLKTGRFLPKQSRVAQFHEAGVGKIVKGVNTTDDVQPGETKRQAKKFGFEINDDNEPPKLTEAKVIRTADYPIEDLDLPNFNIYRQPTGSELRSLLAKHHELRGTLRDEDGKHIIYVWDAHMAHHLDVREILEVYFDAKYISFKDSFYISDGTDIGSPTWGAKLRKYPSGVHMATHPMRDKESLNHPAIKKLLLSTIQNVKEAYGAGWEKGPYKNVTELVPVTWLKQYIGNELRTSLGGKVNIGYNPQKNDWEYSDKLEDLAASMKKGVQEPLVLIVAYTDQKAWVGEGNHRIAAADIAGITHLPVRVVTYKHASNPRAKDVSHITKLPTNAYVPSEMKPSDALHLPVKEALEPVRPGQKTPIDVIQQYINNNPVVEIYKKTGNCLIRGVKDAPTGAFIGKPRQERKPLNTPDWVHDTVNGWFEINGYEARRDNSIFCYPVPISSLSVKKNRSSMYGDYYLIIPLEPFNFTYSLKESDLFTGITSKIDSEERIMEFLASLDFKKGKNAKDLEHALRESEFGYEMMISGNYLAIRINDDYWPYIEQIFNLESSMKENEILPDVKTPSPEDVALKHDVSLKQIYKELKIGISVEMEHTKDRKLSKEIALDHLSEMPDYYSRLKKMEAK